MNIWFDICHTPQFNFFKPVMKALVEKGHRIYVTVLDRGKTPKIIQHELSGWQNVMVDVVGQHRMTKWSAIVEANLLRDWQLMRWIRGKKIDIGFSNGMQLAMVCGLKGIPNYSFDDDPQTADRKWKEKWNTVCNFCVYEDEAIKAPSHVLRCTKEWAYLNPRTFVPKVEVLERYGVKPKEYMFLREVSVGTINYTGQESGAILGIKDMIPKGMKVLLSLEEKKRRSEYPEDWILLQEPIEDSQFLHLGGLCHHRYRCQAEVQVKYQRQHHRCHRCAVGYRLEIFLKTLVGLHTVVELQRVVEAPHLAQQVHGALQLLGVVAIQLPESLHTRCFEVGNLAHFIEEHVRCNMQFHAQINHSATVHRLDANGLL